MSRYLIIDTAELDGHKLSLVSASGNEMILSPEESMAKFKEIWDEGLKEGVHIGAVQDVAHEYDYLWEDYSKKL